MRSVGVALFCLSLASSALAVNGAGNRKQATATRVPNGAIRVDGRLDDEACQKATPITDFIQKEPTEGAAPTDADRLDTVWRVAAGSRRHGNPGDDR
jgi:hypothetical protein